MEYVLIIFFQCLGIAFHVMQKVVSLGDKFPKETVRTTFATFLQEDWDTLVISGLILMLDLGTNYLLFGYLKFEHLPQWYWQLAPFAVSLILGYAGQRLIYKWFGTAEKYLDKQVTDRLQ